jgi:hypothetical protein
MARRRGGWKMGARMDSHSNGGNGAMQVATVSGLIPEGSRQTLDAAARERRGLVVLGGPWWSGEGRAAVCCMMKYPRSDTGVDRLPAVH